MNKNILDEFSVLKKSSNQPIYLDSACTTLCPDRVINKSNQFYREFPSCPNRSIHGWSKKSNKEINLARETIKNFINAPRTEEIVFTKNTTESLNLVSQGIDLSPGDTVLITSLEHNSNLLPWQKLRVEKNINLKFLDISPPNYSIDLVQLEDALKTSHTKILSIFYTSNVTGTTLPVAEIIKIAHKYNTLVMLDCAQAISTHIIDVINLDVDFLAFSSHKMFGVNGIGVLYGKYNLLKKLNPLILGGETVLDVELGSYTPANLPYRLEAGIQNYSGIIALAEAINFVSDLGGPQNISNHCLKLNTILTENLSSNKKINLVGPNNPSLRPTIYNFFIENKNMGEFSILLDQSRNIFSRSGVHCAHAWYHLHKLPPSLRISFSIYNTEEQVQLVTDTINDLIRFL
jgi:cysteine desulfurase/selenocysteine lyase